MSGTNLTLQSTGLSWAIFSLAMAEDQRPTAIHITGTSDGVWLGVSDFGHDCWRWRAGDFTGNLDVETLPPDILDESGAVFHLVLVCEDDQAAELQVSVDLTVETWNVMVWLAGDNWRAKDALNALNRLETVGSTEQIRLLAGFDIDPAQLDSPVTGTDQARYIRVVQDEDPDAIVVDGDTANQSFTRSGFDSSDPARLADFIAWADSNFLYASHTMLVLFGVGDGWVSRSASAADGRQARGVLSDQADGAGLTNVADLAAALDGEHFNILCFDASYMAQASVLAELNEYELADYYIASQGLVPMELPYDTLISGWTDQFPLPPMVLAAFTASFAVNQWEGVEGKEGCMAVFRSENIDPMTDALAALATGVTPKASAEGAHVIAAIQAAYDPLGSTAARDLGGFLEDYRANTTDPAVQGLLDSALAAYEDYIYDSSQSINIGNSGATGASIFQPTETELAEYKDDYRPLQFNQDTGWLEMLEATGVPGSDPYPYSLDWTIGDRMIATWDDPDVDLKLIVVDPSYNEGWPGYPDELAGVIEFSEDSQTSGSAVEWARLLAGAPVGTYTAMLNYSGTGTADLHVALELQDETNATIQDMGTITISPGSEHDIADLFYDDGSSVEWAPGDYLQISWTDANAEFDLFVTDPNDNTGLPGSPEMLSGKVEFSPDSAESGEQVEWAKLLIGGDYGYYDIDIWYWDYAGTPPATLDVAVQLFDSGDALKHDFGAVTFNGDDYNDETDWERQAALLQYLEP